MNQVIALVVAYLLGSIPFALIAGKLHGVDLRTMGSGNLGATNVFRTLGRTAGITVMVLDIAKGAAAVLVAEALTNNPWPLAAGALAILGHVFPVWTNFKGGKGVAVGAGARAIVCSPLEVSAIRGAVPADITLITPGVRPAGAGVDDQKRVATPESALAAGADLLVIGRPITAAADPGAAARAIRDGLAATR